MKRIIFVSVIALAILSSCSNKNKTNPLYYSNDMESANCWNDNNTLVVGAAHSGKTFSKVTPESPYSFTFHKLLKDISSKRVRRVEYSCWVNLSSSTSQANLVLAIDTVGKSLLWVGTPTKEFVSVPNKWVKMKGKATIPANINRENEIKIYVWDNGKDAVSVDDFEITFKE
jgi:hypothetical protein